MKTNKIAITVCTLLIGYHLASAAAIESKFKLAVVKDAPGTTALKSGIIEKSISSALAKDKADPFEKAMTLCVANLKMGAISSARSACSSAIAYNYPESNNSRKKAQLKAFAYNNRAIVNYMASDMKAAMADFNQALALTNDANIKANFHRFTREIATTSLLK